MSLFFLVVGLEFSREVTVGELHAVRSIVVPALGAIGGWRCRRSSTRCSSPAYTGRSGSVPTAAPAPAGAGPVTITPLASFDAASQPVLRFGYYTPGDPTDQTELFTLMQSDAQTVNPTAQGATSFDPGSNTFGLYAIYPGVSTSNGQPDTHYSEDAFNTLDPTYHRKFRFFPLENADKSVVPNAYVVAAEDYNNPQFNSFVNFVGIIRNVQPAPDAVGAPVIGLENLDGLPYADRMFFTRIQIPNATIGDTVHDTGTMRIHNSGDQPLVIHALTLSDPTNWQVVNPPAPGTTVAPGGTLDVTVKFIAQSDPPHSDNQTNDTQTTNGIPVQAAGGVINERDAEAEAWIFIAIGLAFIYLLFSVLCSAAQEGIATFFDMRARTLEKGINSLLEDNGLTGDGVAQPVPAPAAAQAGAGSAHPGRPRRQGREHRPNHRLPGCRRSRFHHRPDPLGQWRPAYVLSALARGWAGEPDFHDRPFDALDRGADRAVARGRGRTPGRCALGAALAGRPALIVLDEPTSQLDPVAGDELIGSLRRLTEDYDAAILNPEHRLARCPGLADRVLALERGRTAFDGTPVAATVI